MAGLDHSARRRAGVADRHLRGDAGPRLLAQHAVALRPGARHRHRRGRCHRGGGERRTAHRAGAAADGGDETGDGGSLGTDHRHCARARRGVRADGVHQRPDRAVLPAVRVDDRHLDLHLGVQLADAEPGAGVAAAPRARRAARPRPARHRSACSAGSSAASTVSFTRGSSIYAGGVSRGLRVAAVVLVRLRGTDRADRRRLQPGAAGLHSAAGQGLSRRFRAAARWRDARSHRTRHPADVGAGARAPGRHQLGGVPWSVDQRLRQRAEHRHRVHHPEALERARQDARHGRQPHRGGAQPAVRVDPGRLRRHLPAAAGAGPRAGRRLQAVCRGPRRARLRGAVSAGAERGRRRAEGTGAGRPVLELPGERAADRRPRRSRAGEDLRHSADRRLRHAAGLSRVALRQRLQPVRTHLSGQRAGRVVVPHAAGADRAAEDAERPRRDGAARIGAACQPHLRTRSGDALQRLSRPRRSTARRRRATARGRRRRRSPACSSARCPTA